VQRDETPEDALYRELYEEVGLTASQVRIVARTSDWLHYDLPSRYRRRPAKGKQFRGQKQIWFLLRLLGDESAVCLDNCDRPEFDKWMWIDYWSAVENIVDFKRKVYELALSELETYLPDVPFYKQF
jgi:putative (di)nucleoside polyphosphate hydrolase